MNIFHVVCHCPSGVGRPVRPDPEEAVIYTLFASIQYFGPTLFQLGLSQDPAPWSLSFWPTDADCDWKPLSQIESVTEIRGS